MDRPWLEDRRRRTPPEQGDEPTSVEVVTETISDFTAPVNAHHTSHWLNSLNVNVELSVFLVFLCIPVNKSSVHGAECTVYFSLRVVH